MHQQDDCKSNKADVECENNNEKAQRLSNDSDNALVPGTIKPEDHTRGLQLMLVMISLSFCNILCGLDYTVIATAIPVITSRFHSLQDVGWYGSAYFIAMCAGLPVTGKLFSLCPKKEVYLGCLFVFEVGSLVCALAPTSGALIAGRAVGGIGAAGMLTGSSIIVATITPLNQRAMLTGILSSAFGVAQIIGPLIGGAFTERVSWRWCFYINLPIGGVAAAVIVVVLHLQTAETEKVSLQQKAKSFDIVGLVLVAGAIVELLFALEWGGTMYAWNSSVVIGLFVGSGVTFAVFVCWQLRMGDSALMPPKLFDQRTTVLAFGASLLAHGGFECVVYFLPIWFQSVLRASPVQSSVRYLPTVVSDVVTSFVAGALVMHLGCYKPFLLLGTALVSLGSGLLTTLYPTINEGRWIGYQILGGVGFSLISVMPHMALQSLLPPDLIPVATSTLGFAMAASCSLLLSLAQTIFHSRLRHDLLHTLTAAQTDAVISAGASADAVAVSTTTTNLPPDLLPAVREAYSQAVTDTFYIPAVGAAAAFFLVLGMKWTNTKSMAKSSRDRDPSTKSLDLERESGSASD